MYSRKKKRNRSFVLYESYVTNMFEKLFCECRYLNSLNIPLSVETVCVYCTYILCICLMAYLPSDKGMYSN
jgi:hypothetical protein